MTIYLMRRLGIMLVTLVGVSVLIFILMRAIPGSVVDVMFDTTEFVDPVQKAQIEEDLGLDKPLVGQYFKWVGGLFKGDLGYSYYSEMPAWDEIMPRLPVSAKLAGLTLFFTVAFGVPLGVISAVKQNSLVDNFVRGISIAALSIPSFWCALLVLMLAVQLFGVIPIYSEQPRTLLGELWILSLPALVIGFRSSALIMRMTRSSMLEVMRQDYIRTARAKGASSKSINFHHALKNATLPVITLIGLEAAHLIGGLVVTETVFNIPGVARFLVESIKMRDYPIVQNMVMLTAVVVLVVNFVVDMLYAAVDPRIKYAN